MLIRDMTQTVGNTPLLEMSRFVKARNLNCRILAKLECFNPASSVKDRVALAMVEDAERRGVLKSGATIIEPTSGNTGIGLAWVAAVKGYKMILTMPETMSVERRKLAAQFGARVVLTPGAEGMRGAIKKAKELNCEIANSWTPSQFDNPANPEAHRRTTAVEILRDTEGKIDLFVCGVGSGGTLSGVGAGLKAELPDLRIYAVEPDTSAVLSGGPAGAHKLQGIGAGFVPQNLNTKLYDGVIQVSAEEAFAAARDAAKTEGVLVGVSSGAALAAAAKLGAEIRGEGLAIVVVLPDTGERYLSTELFE